MRNAKDAEEEFTIINKLKEHEGRILVLIKSINGCHRWKSIAMTHMQEGFMAAERSINNPDNIEW